MKALKPHEIWIASKIEKVCFKDNSEERSVLELTEREKRIVQIFIRRIGIWFTIEGIILALCAVAILVFVFLVFCSLVFSMLS